MKAVSVGTLTAEATEDSLNPKLGSYTVRIRDEKGDLVAIFQGLAYRKKEVIDFSKF
jgi:acyl-CoA thioesterase